MIYNQLKKLEKWKESSNDQATLIGHLTADERQLWAPIYSQLTAGKTHLDSLAISGLMLFQCQKTGISSKRSTIVCWYCVWTRSIHHPVENQRPTPTSRRQSVWISCTEVARTTIPPIDGLIRQFKWVCSIDSWRCFDYWPFALPGYRWARWFCWSELRTFDGWGWHAQCSSRLCPRLLVGLMTTLLALFVLSSANQHKHSRYRRRLTHPYWVDVVFRYRKT